MFSNYKPYGKRPAKAVPQFPHFVICPGEQALVIKRESPHMAISAEKRIKIRMLIASCFVVQLPILWYRCSVETTYASTNNELSHFGYL